MHLPNELTRLLQERFRTDPDKVLYTFITGTGTFKNLTHRELYIKARALAVKLCQQENSDERRALLVYQPGFDFIVALFACFLSNTIAIPIAIPKPRTLELFRHFLNHANPHLVLTDSELIPRMNKLIGAENLEKCKLLATDEVEPSENDEIPATLQDSTAVIQYTSGTTTKPKGVIISFENILLNLKAIQQHFHLSQQSVCFSWLPHYHDMGLIDGLLTPFFNNCTGVLCAPVQVVADPKRWMEIITQFKVTHTGGPNFFFDLCTKRINTSIEDNIDLRSLSHVYVSAEPVRKETLEKFSDAFARFGFTENMFTPGYGLAEATLMVTCKNIRSNLNYYTHEGHTHVGLGHPIPGIDIRIVNPDTCQEVTDGTTGEICLNGPTISKGYYKAPEATKRARINLLINNLLRPYLRTGDVGTIKNGELVVMGRLADTLIINGLKYQPEDLEYVIARAHPTITSMTCAAFCVEEENTTRLIVVQEFRKSNTGSAEEVKAAIKNSIFEAFGLTVFVVILLAEGRILKTTSGKVMRNKNRIMYLQKEFIELA